ncbi:H-NS histone family protein [Burkholderia sp. 4701]|nr:H-NS histone family protein [Burkholderia sp. 4701]MXN86389.1 H-NS histone family protein [Burkholderia sp. 4812]
MQAYKDYLELKKRFDKELESERKKVIGTVISEIQTCIGLFNLSADDIFPLAHQARRKRRAKYYDPASGSTWSGVGREPIWIKGKDKSKFLIEPNHPE